MKNTKIIAWGVRLVSRQISQLKLLMACLMIGVFALTATIASVDTFTKGLQSNGAELLGGDIGVVSRNNALPDDVIDNFKSITNRVTQMVRLRSMVKSANGLSLSELKGIDDHYPLLGTAESSAGKTLPKAGEIIIDPELAKTLNVSIGDTVEVGAINVTVTGIYKTEPEIDIAGIGLAPRSILHMDDIRRTDLLVQGSQVYYGIMGLVSDDVDVNGWQDSFDEKHEKQRYRTATRERPSGNIDRIVRVAQYFFMVLSLAVVAISGIGIQMAMRVYLSRNIATLAILKSLGLGQGKVLLFMASMVGALSLFVSVIGAGLGSLVPVYVVPLIEDMLPFAMPSYYAVGALVKGIIFGVLASYTFSAIPILRSMNVKGADLFRSVIIPPSHLPFWGKVGAGSLLVLSIAFVLFLSGDAERMSIFVGAILVGALLLYLLARLCVYGLSKLSGIKNTSLRLAVANLTSKGNATVHVVVSLGMGLTLFTAVITVYQSAMHYLDDIQNGSVPNILVLDIKRNQVIQTESILKQNATDVESIHMHKTITVRVKAINGVPSEKLRPDGDAWFVRGDRRSTWLTDMPENNQTVAGTWWTEKPNRLEVSVESEVAKNYNITVGSTIDISVMGRPMTATVVHIRKLNFLSPSANFAMIFNPQAFDNAPYSALSHGKVDDFEKTRNSLSSQFPNQLIISIEKINEMVASVVWGIVIAIKSISALTLLAGVLVLVGAMTAETEAKTYNSVVLKMIGGTRAYVARIFMLEYFVLGLLGGVFSVVPGYVLGYIVTVDILQLPLSADMAIAMLVSLFTVMFVLLVGGFILWRILSIKPATILRQMI